MTAQPTTASPKPERPPYLYVQRPRCPSCGGGRLLVYRSVDNGDATRTRYAKCSDCKQRVVIVVE